MSLVKKALEQLAIKHGDPDYKRTYSTLSARAKAQLLKGQKVTVNSLTKGPIRQKKPPNNPHDAGEENK